ncbi:hypothetical protein SAMN05421874_11614 [Nonomuraea maritima]|uniref:Uncharacterized protein n=1 Tax=Nonomuraea maritima TaxID=683260 RepID=A0A1G9HFL2_9ACTN|nr:hypothetical protein [Nonomuraea maritima]SDL11659.1 hypothetical protein SAMN05421874_11614 [Nonomuraea maritima]
MRGRAEALHRRRDVTGGLSGLSVVGALSGAVGRSVRAFALGTSAEVWGPIRTPGL